MAVDSLKLDDEELTRVIEAGEDSRVEFKRSLTGSAPDRIREAVCAFANDLSGSGRPGVVIVGMKDDGTPADISVTDETLRALTDMRSDGNILPPPTLLAEKRLYRGSEVAVLTVLPSDSPPVRYKGVVHIRGDPRRGIATAQEERILNERRQYGDRPFDIAPVPGTGANELHRRRSEEEYRPNAVARDPLQANERTFDERLAAAKMTASVDDGRATILGLPVLGRRPRDFIPGAYDATNAPIRVNWFDDRIEIQNPGGPFGAVTAENFARPGVTDYRDPNLAEAMKVSGYVQRFGVGIPTARRLLREAGHPEIEFTVEPTHLLATVKSRPRTVGNLEMTIPTPVFFNSK